jgi:hypothetical protein
LGFRFLPLFVPKKSAAKIAHKIRALLAAERRDGRRRQ